MLIACLGGIPNPRYYSPDTVSITLLFCDLHTLSHSYFSPRHGGTASWASPVIGAGWSQVLEPQLGVQRRTATIPRHGGTASWPSPVMGAGWSQVLEAQLGVQSVAILSAPPRRRAFLLCSASPPP